MSFDNWWLAHKDQIRPPRMEDAAREVWDAAVAAERERWTLLLAEKWHAGHGMGQAPERAAFEAWATGQGLALNRHRHSYAATSTAWCWDAWQGGRAAERERCAKLCEREAQAWRDVMEPDVAAGVEAVADVLRGGDAAYKRRLT